MSKPTPLVLFLAELADSTKLAVSQLAEHVALAIECDEGVAAVKLPAEQAVALGLALLSANLEELPRQAGRMDQRTAQVLAASLLVPTVADGLLDLATQGVEPQ